METGKRQTSAKVPKGSQPGLQSTGEGPASKGGEGLLSFPPSLQQERTRRERFRCKQEVGSEVVST